MILYSFRRCPYAMRARMALLHTGVLCELREVVLKNKPAKMLDVSPKGTVPVLQLDDGRVIDESLDIMQWALGQSGSDNELDTWLAPQSGTREEMLALIEKNDGAFKYHLDRYKYPERYEGVESAFHRQQGSEFLMKLENVLNQHDFLFGNETCLADIAVFPFVRQFSHVDRKWFSEQPWPALKRWLEVFLSSALFKHAMVKYMAWQHGDTPIYLNG